MAKSKIVASVAAVALVGVLALAGCAGQTQQTESSQTASSGSSKTSTTSTAAFVTPTPQDGAISVNVADLSEAPTFVNYDANGTTVQLIAGIASDGTARIALNTCQVCNPSPKAYFAQSGNKLVCQNCGNKFTMDDVGDAALGCNPTQVEFTESNGVISVPTSALDAEAKAFAKWQGPTA